MLLFAESICRICVLLSSRVFLHLDGFGRTFVTFSGLEWSTYKPREDRFHSTLPLTYIRKTMERRRILASTQHPAEAWSMCGYYLRWLRISKNDVSSSVSDISSFHLCCRNF